MITMGTSKQKGYNMLPENNDYKNLVEEIKSKVRQAQYSAMVKVNGEMIQLYWNIGKELNEQVQL